MPALKWTPEAVADLDRLIRFLRTKSPEAARRAAGAIRAGGAALIAHPDIGKPLGDGRRDGYVAFGAGAYVLRYRLESTAAVVVVRVWHSREDRS